MSLIGCPRVDRQVYTLCHNAKCSKCDARTNICLLRIEVCSDRVREQRTENGGRI